jgi:hypothetical protein
MAEGSAADFTVGKIQKDWGQRVAKMYSQQKRNIIHRPSTAYEQDHSSAAPPSSVMKSQRFTRSPRRRAAGIDVDNSTPNHLNIHVSERDYDINPRFSAFIGFVVHGYPHNDFRIFCPRLRPFALNNFRLFEPVSRRCMNILRYKWPRGYAAEQRDEIAPSRSSAWKQNLCSARINEAGRFDTARVKSRPHIVLTACAGRLSRP